MAEDYPLIPPGGGGGAPLGPGAMVANTLQGILAQRRAEAHNALIEKLAQDKQSWEQQYQQGDLNLRQQANNTNEQWRKDEGARANAQAKKLTDDDTAKQASLARVREWAHTQGLGPVTTPDDQAMYGFMEQFPDRAEQLLQAELAKRAAKKAMVPGLAWNQKLQKYEPIHNPDGTPYNVPEGSTPFREQPVPNAPRNASAFFEIVNDKDPNQKMPFGVSGEATGMPVAPTGWHFSGLKVGADTPRAAGKPGPKIAPALANKLADLRKKASPGRSIFGMGGKPDDKDVAAFNQERKSIITNYPTSDTVRLLTMNTLSDPEFSDVPTAVAHHTETQQLSPQEQADLTELLTVLK